MCSILGTATFSVLLLGMKKKKKHISEMWINRALKSFSWHGNWPSWEIHVLGM
jgi:hypothetical protein